MNLKHKLVKLRKPRRCHGCGQRFPSGAILLYSVNIFEGDFCYACWCSICEKISINSHDGVDFGELRETDEYIELLRTTQIFIMEKESWPNKK